MAPWKFSLTQSMFSGSLATILLAVVIAWKAIPLGASATDPVGRLASWLVTFAAPFSWSLVASSSAIATLRPADWRNKAKRVAAASRFLYLDGALGFWPQVLLSLGYGLLMLLVSDDGLNEIGDGTLVLSFAGPGFMALGLSWQYAISRLVIPPRLFLLNGYSRHPERVWRKLGERVMPYRRYSQVMFLVSLLTIAYVPVVAWLVSVIACRVPFISRLVMAA